jgi:hypothetical protein
VKVIVEGILLTVDVNGTGASTLKDKAVALAKAAAGRIK